MIPAVNTVYRRSSC